MSIIHEALKKVQANLQGQQAQSTTPPPAQATENVSFSSVVDVEEAKEVPVKEKAKLLPMIAGGVILAALLWLIGPRLIPHPLPVPAPKPIDVSAPATLIAPPSATNTSSSPTVTQNILDVQGVMSSNGKSVALINNKIYEEGSEIAGAKILTISANTITVLRDGHEESIAVKN